MTAELKSRLRRFASQRITSANEVRFLYFRDLGNHNVRTGAGDNYAAAQSLSRSFAELR
jgi:uncharacterized protein YgiM (DUF1202 family)